MSAIIEEFLNVIMKRKLFHLGDMVLKILPAINNRNSSKKVAQTTFYMIIMTLNEKWSL